jgi:hypothetical protein
MSPLLRIATALAIAVLPVAGHAATLTYNAVVTESVDVTGAIDRPNYDLPDVGTMGTITIDLGGPLFDGSSTIPGEFVNLSGFLSASASFGTVSAALLPSAAAILPAGGGVRFANGTFGGIDVDNMGSIADSTLAGSFTVSSLSFPDPAMTLQDVLDKLGASDARVSFSFNGSVNGATDFVSFRAVSVTAPVPLPAGGLLLLTGLGAVGLLRRRA